MGGFGKKAAKIQRTWIVAFLHADIARRFYRGHFIVVGHVATTAAAAAADYNNNEDAAAAALVYAKYTKQKQTMPLSFGEKILPSMDLPIYPISPLMNMEREGKNRLSKSHPRTLPPPPL